MKWEIVVGPFTSKAEADRCADKVRRKGKGWWPVKVHQISNAKVTPSETEVSLTENPAGASRGKIG